MYGAQWCKDCRRSKALLDTAGVDYTNVDLEADPDRVQEAESIAGRKNIPVLAFSDGLVLVEPTDEELTTALIERQMIS